MFAQSVTPRGTKRPCPFGTDTQNNKSVSLTSGISHREDLLMSQMVADRLDTRSSWSSTTTDLDLFAPQQIHSANAHQLLDTHNGAIFEQFNRRQYQAFDVAESNDKNEPGPDFSADLAYSTSQAPGCPEAYSFEAGQTLVPINGTVKQSDTWTGNAAFGFQPFVPWETTLLNYWAGGQHATNSSNPINSSFWPSNNASDATISNMDLSFSENSQLRASEIGENALVMNAESSCDQGTAHGCEMNWTLNPIIRCIDQTAESQIGELREHTSGSDCMDYVCFGAVSLSPFCRAWKAY